MTPTICIKSPGFTKYARKNPIQGLGQPCEIGGAACPYTPSCERWDQVLKERSLGAGGWMESLHAQFCIPLPRKK